MSQYLPTVEFEKLSFPNQYDDNYPDEYNQKQAVKDLLQIPENNEYGFSKECDVEYPGYIEESTLDIPLCSILRLYEFC